MTDASSTPEDLADQSNWTLIADDDEVWSPAAELPPALADPRPPLLNTHEMGWEPFERLVLGMARTLDGAYAVHRYGRPGQAQHGLDVVAFRHGHAPSAYQAKHWQEFGAADLKEAVELYMEGERPFGADPGCGAPFPCHFDGFLKPSLGPIVVASLFGTDTIHSRHCIIVATCSTRENSSGKFSSSAFTDPPLVEATQKRVALEADGNHSVGRWPFR